MGQFSAHRLSAEEVGLAKAMLANTLDRPSPLEIAVLSHEAINAAARELDYPVLPLDRFETLHLLAQPLIESKINWLLKRHETDKPIYIFVGRDGEMMYDALLAVGQGTELEQRVKLATLSFKHARDAELSNNEGEALRVKAYLAQMGMSKDSIQVGKRIVVVDSALVGSVIESMYLMTGPGLMVRPIPNLWGYLVYAGEGALYPEMGWHPTVPDNGFFTVFWEELGKGFWEMVPQNVWWQSTLKSRKRSTSWALAVYLQVQPKYTPPSFRLEKVGNILRSRPNPAHGSYPRILLGSMDLQNITMQPSHINSCSVDPVAAARLQLITVRYFSSPEVRHRVLGLS